MIVYRNFINGQWRESASSKTVENINPARISDVLGTVKLATCEEGKTISEPRGELQRASKVSEFCAGEARRLNGETIQSGSPSNFAYTIKQPLGVVAYLTARDFYTDLKVVYVDYDALP